MCAKKIGPRLELPMPGGKVFVDMGCGAGEFLDQLTQTYEIAVGADMSIVWLKKRDKPRKGWYFVLADLNKQLPIENDYADLVISNQVIEHVTDPFLFSNEIYRILRSGRIR
jgi:ubiquinone/menaquinone biosynthesis C-methylase UbiE